MLIRLTKEKDIATLSRVFSDSFTNIDPEKPWSRESSENLLRFFYDKQPDLFFVATEEELIIGGMAYLVKPWRDGNRCVEGILFIDPNYQNRGVGKKLFIKIIEQALEKYNTKFFEGITFDGIDFPNSWYKKIQFNKYDGALLIKGNSKEMLNILKSSL